MMRLYFSSRTYINFNYLYSIIIKIEKIKIDQVYFILFYTKSRHFYT